MTLTIAQAVEVALVELAKTWDADDGTLHVEITLEDADDFMVNFGAREWIVDGNPAYILMGDVFAFVNKETGQLRRASALDDADARKLAIMTSV
ncbi:immunity protein [Arthrobacter phage Jawnski]|uniref:Uncharacterized protein n=3 Tax=Jawnskivirus TaxID=3425003 RepID=A0A222Z2J1_9CAUD|nr:immunity protein [Arthrobacter phage Brent]YP_009601565.1 immunity protein [Arthrobacter phage Jawnski]ALF01216.1 hypothetical protein SEA_BRENT_5 [Arthrobacter phage Brent]ALY09335.1 hypothetical protein JAWNSKI_5 [Arthrobacter phage Jawnski]ASR78177.1 hypothetical protein SEA_FRANZY_5 [Arthrobacter phage Franzy]